MKVLLIGGHSDGRIIEVPAPTTRRWCNVVEVPYAIGGAVVESDFFSMKVPVELQYVVEVYHIESLTEGGETFYFGRHPSVRTKQAVLRRLIEGYRPNAKDIPDR